MRSLEHVEIVGGGPAGLYTAILLRRRLPHVSVRVTERNPAGTTFGFGVVFSSRALGFLERDDPEMHDLIVAPMERWSNLAISHQGQEVTLDGQGLMAIGRLELLEIMRAEAKRLGVHTDFGTEITDLDALEADLVIGADGLNSIVRSHREEIYQPSIEYFSNRFAWFGASIAFDPMFQTFVQTDKGPLNSHHYRYAADRSTFIVECEQDTFHTYGFDEMDEAQSAEVCSDIFSEALQGTSLITNHSVWRQFPRVWCERWVAGRHVLVGDAARTAHFSVGSGTRLALDDVIALVDALANQPDIDMALHDFETNRQPIAKKLVDAANTSAKWYETFSEKMQLPIYDFAYDYLGRTGRLDDEKLRQAVPGFMREYDAWQARGTGPDDELY